MISGFFVLNFHEGAKGDFARKGNKKAPDDECLGRQTQRSSNIFFVSMKCLV
jgi:hypothetical protein